MANLGSFDFSELVKFRDNLVDMQRHFPDFMRKCLYHLADEMLADVVMRTPSSNGALRRGWTLGELRPVGDGYEIEVHNTEEYSFYVENGFAAHWVPGKWVGNTFYYIKNYEPPKGEPGGMYVGPRNGWVEGKFMMLISSELLEREIPAIMEREMQRFIDRFLR
ncbi:HK97 gp10 family phage protein [Cohnella sp. LGH]|uniref:HK97 gp10 family phage protein n=1 Tax=Cohnella sp. LGH TaxID=1619153 RepID=UPI001ADC36CE|nr:HK97 gp10 family phage protein [Cohnella sp. LGH]QTH44960.1 HK97 gp10 family phage protein [Cohnella sp. LGH]